MKKGGFRGDLYYRLNVIRIHLPPLRERKEDIPMLVDHFIRIYAQRENENIKGITNGAMEDLLRDNFPGNVRELENISNEPWYLVENIFKRMTWPIFRQLKLETCRGDR